MQKEEYKEVLVKLPKQDNKQLFLVEYLVTINYFKGMPPFILAEDAEEARAILEDMYGLDAECLNLRNTVVAKSTT
ncbi:hypothetical protein Elgi_37430 [Paenibacillus elgii]|uniref:hypothetical protein n=1 Tax=Paenibacillus elgii TaxID=189691 RepID=UPI002D7C1297|nr:hypothetical protein Elgi_37430 [Paenibacillus elgii]